MKLEKKKIAKMGFLTRDELSKKKQNEPPKKNKNRNGFKHNINPSRK